MSVPTREEFDALAARVGALEQELEAALRPAEADPFRARHEAFVAAVRARESAGGGR